MKNPIQANGQTYTISKTRYKFSLALFFALSGFISVMAQPGTLDPDFDPGFGAGNTIYTVLLQLDGKIIIGGSFTSFNEISRNRIARLNSDGTLDTSFDAGTGPNGYIFSAALQPDGKIIIGGAFTSYDGTPVNGIARLNPDGTRDTSFNPGFDPGGAEGGSIFCISLLPGGKIMIGGGFTSYNFTSRNRIARLNSDGSLDLDFDPGTAANSSVLSILPQPDNKVIIGGNFTSYNDLPINRIARLNSDGNLDGSFNPGTGTDLLITAVRQRSDGKIIIGGAFTTYNLLPRDGLALLDPDGTLDSAFDPGWGADGSGIKSIDFEPGGKIIIGGNFTMYGGVSRNYLARLNADGTLDGTFNPTTGPDEGIESLIIQSDERLLIGGYFDNYDGVDIGRIARINLKTTQTLTFSALPNKTYGDSQFDLSATGGGSGNPVTYTSSDPSVATIDGITVTIVGVGTTEITASQEGNDDYYPAENIVQTLTVDPLTITVTADANQSKLYGSDEPAFTYEFNPMLIGGDTFNGVLSRESGENAGLYAITVGNLSAGSNYAITFESANFEITPLPITVTANDNQTKVYGSDEPVLTYQVTPGLIAGDSFNGALERTAGVDVDTYAITIGDLSAGNNYAITFVTADFEITPLAVTVTADPEQTKNYGSSDPVLTYQVTPALIGGDTFTGVLERAAGEDVDTYAITIGNLDAGLNYTVTFVTGNFEITPLVITVTPDENQSKIYGSEEPVLTYQFTPDLVSGDAFTGVLTRLDGENVGKYVITQGTLDVPGGNYTINFENIEFYITPLSITVTADANQSKVYGSDEPAFTYEFSPMLIGGDTFNGVLSRESGENAGLYAITVGNLSAGSNYAITFESANFEITPLPITVTANDNQSKVYGSDEPTFTYEFSPMLIGGDTFNGVLSRESGEDAGTYAITVGNLSASSTGNNYAITFESADFEITPLPITVTANANQNKVYGSADPVLTYQVTPGLIAGDSFDGDLERATGEDVDTYAITIGDLDAGLNYTVTFVTGNFEITPLVITVTPDEYQSKIYGSSDPVLAYQVSPDLVSGDALTGELTRLVGENVGKYVITLGALYAGDNYTINLENIEFYITPKPLTLTGLTVADKEYDGTTDAIISGTPTLEGIAGSDVVTLGSGSLSADFEDTSAGTGKNVTISGITLTGTDAGNYTLSTTLSGAASIFPRAITVTTDAGQNKTYGSLDPPFTYQFIPDLIGGDTFNGELSRASGEDAGTYGITVGTLSAGNNYAITFVTADFEITPLAVTVTANPEQTKNYGSSDPVLTYQVTPALIGGDTFTGVLERAAGEDVDTYEINNGTLDGGGNYTITFEISNFTITPKTLSVTGITISNKEYDGTTDAIISGTPTLEGIVGSDVVSLGSGSLSANFEDANAGSGKNVTVSGITLTGTNAGNYTLSTTLPVTANITPRAIAVTANTNQSKTYGSSDPILTYQVTPSLISGDTFTGALSRGSGENTGTYSITMSSLSAGGNYTITFVGEDFTITPLAITVTANPNQNKVFGSTDPALTYSVNPSLVAGDSFTGQLSRVVGENAGSYAISIGTLSAGSNYQITFESGNFIIEKASHTITFDLIEDRFNTSEPFTVNATASSGLEVMFNILSGPATVNGSSVTLTGETGSVTVRASSEDENHYEATADQSFEITLDPVLGMEETWKRDIVIFPVPSDGMITIRSGEQEMQKVFLLDISGKLIWKSSQEKPVREMEIEIQEKGEFLVFIQTGKGMISRKIIKY